MDMIKFKITLQERTAIVPFRLKLFNFVTLHKKLKKKKT